MGEQMFQLQVYELISIAYRALFSALLLTSATSTHAAPCDSLPPPPPIGQRVCQLIPLPSDLESPDNSFVSTLGTSSVFPYAQITTPPVCYAEVSNNNPTGEHTRWYEKSYEGVGDVRLERRFIFQRPKYSASIYLPLIIWAHPQGGSESLVEDNNPEVPNYASREIGNPALKNGFAFMSLEFRHPTSSRRYQAPKPSPPPGQNGDSPDPHCALESSDIATAIQFARLHATQLQIDRDNIFVIGQSRGSLALLNALMNDRIDISKDRKTDYRAWSSKPSAVFLVQAQTTYEHNQVKSLFLKPTATVAETYGSGSNPNGILSPPIDVQFPLCVSGANAVFNYHCHWDLADIVINYLPNNPISALDQLEQNDPPVWIRYEKPPPSLTTVVPVGAFVSPAGTDQTKAKPEYCYDRTATGCFDVHHPNFGLRLRLNYKALNIPFNKSAYVYAEYANTTIESDILLAEKYFYKDYWCFFLSYERSPGGTAFTKKIITSGADDRRRQAMAAYASKRTPDDPPETTYRFCKLSELQPWVWNAP
jgi:hypothetical protein